jgi:hypothetical protein
MLKRMAERQYPAVLPQQPLRITRAVPAAAPPGHVPPRRSLRSLTVQFSCRSNQW